MNTMADGAAQRLVAQIGEALFGQPGLTLMELAEKVKGMSKKSDEKAIRTLEEIITAIQAAWTGPHRKAVHIATQIALEGFKKELRKCDP